ncbi:hypothetical protein KOW79_002091 [Hemibagrus wyckioides]|uniref:Uncharacterized protein n=1 Tax=Hemibagrus wyckioides TaxID=337641 RepID=A0A9D3P414_9TELE|nr:hypothetical protein KOW79_002091 [Hemibagrus wyckioides]
MHAQPVRLYDSISCLNSWKSRLGVSGWREQPGELDSALRGVLKWSSDEMGFIGIGASCTCNGVQRVKLGQISGVAVREIGPRGGEGVVLSRSRARTDGNASKHKAFGGSLRGHYARRGPAERAVGEGESDAADKAAPTRGFASCIRHGETRRWSRKDLCPDKASCHADSTPRLKSSRKTEPEPVPDHDSSLGAGRTNGVTLGDGKEKAKRHGGSRTSLTRSVRNLLWASKALHVHLLVFFYTLLNKRSITNKKESVISVSLTSRRRLGTPALQRKLGLIHQSDDQERQIQRLFSETQTFTST